MNKEHTTTMITSRRTRGVAAALIALTMIAAACSDDKKDTSTATTVPATTGSSATTAPGSTTPGSTTPETYAPLTGDPIKIGTTILTMPLISFNTRLPGIAAAVDYINAHGGIQGHPLEWVYCGAADAAGGEACAHKMVDEGVIATVSDANYAAEPAEVQILGDAGIPIIDSFMNSAEALSNPNVYEMCQPTPVAFATIPAFMKEKGLTKAAIFYGESAQAQHNIEIFQKAAEYYGVEVVGSTPIPLTATDYLPQVQATVDLGADTNIAMLAPFMTGQALAAADQLGTSFNFGVTEGQFTQAQYAEYGQAGGGLDGALLVGCIPPFSAADKYPAIQDALDNIAAEAESGTYKDLDDGTGVNIATIADPDHITSYTTQGWFATMAFWEATKQITGDVTSESLKNVLDTTDGIDVGLAQPWVPSTPGPAEFSRVSNLSVYLITVKDGKSVLFQDEPVDAGAAFK